MTTMERGGAENHLLDLIQGQIATYGCEIACAYLKGDGYWSQALQHMGVKVVPLGLKRYGEVKPLLRLRQALGTFQPDLVHAHLGPAEMYTRVALLGNSRWPLVMTQHNEGRFYPGPGHVILGRWVTKRACAMIAVSHSVMKFLAERWPDHPGRRLQMIHHGLNPAPYGAVPAGEVAALRQAWGAGRDTLLVGAVARLIAGKGLEALVDGFAAYVQAHPASTAKLVLVGEGSLEPQLRRQVAEAGLGGRVIWAGFRDDIPVVMQALDVFVLNSISEGFGLVLLEAMAAGKPVIAAAVSAIPEIVIDQVTGLLIAPQSPPALMAALGVLESNPGLRQRFGEAGRVRVEQHFPLDLMVSKTVACYQDALMSATR